MYEISQKFQVSYAYSIDFTEDAFEPTNQLLRNIVARLGEGVHRALVVVDSGLVSAQPSLAKSVIRYFSAHDDVMQLVSNPVAYMGGEAGKNSLKHTGHIYELIEKHKICRHSVLIAVGGGAMLDAVGFAASTAHRGIKLIRMPSTVLAQNDAGVGVKNAINYHGKKNFIGSFAVPFAVINDFKLLETLQQRDKRTGIAEAVKVALIRDREFFYQLVKNKDALAHFQSSAMADMIIRCAELHVEHIANSGDPFERGSARPLDFGHWSAHALEQVTEGKLRHGEAVAIGVVLDSLYSQKIGILSESDSDVIIDLLKALGFTLDHPALRMLNVDSALQEFREHLGGQLCITLLDRIGHSIEVNDIDLALMQRCCSELLNHQRPRSRTIRSAA